MATKPSRKLPIPTPLVSEEKNPRTKKEINLILKEAKKNFEEGKKTGLYIAPHETDHINYKSGERFRRMTCYISNLESELKLPFEN